MTRLTNFSISKNLSKNEKEKMNNDINIFSFKISHRQINIFANNIFENSTLLNLNTSLLKLSIVLFELKIK